MLWPFLFRLFSITYRGQKFLKISIDKHPNKVYIKGVKETGDERKRNKN